MHVHMHARMCNNASIPYACAYACAYPYACVDACAYARAIRGSIIRTSPPIVDSPLLWRIGSRSRFQYPWPSQRSNPSAQEHPLRLRVQPPSLRAELSAAWTAATRSPQSGQRDAVGCRARFCDLHLISTAAGAPKAIAAAVSYREKRDVEAETAPEAVAAEAEEQKRRNVDLKS